MSNMINMSIMIYVTDKQIYEKFSWILIRMLILLKILIIFLKISQGK